MSFNWKSPGPSGEQEYWTNNKSLHPIMLVMINQCLNSDEVLVLITKDKAKGREISNYRPITCLSVMWKLFTSLISDRYGKRWQASPAIGWVDYKNTFDMFPHSWTLKCLHIFKIAGNVKRFLTKSIENGETEFTDGGAILGSVKIKRGIFQGKNNLSQCPFYSPLI